MALKGHLHTISITGILQLLCDENKSGVLQAYNRDNQVKFFLKNGSVLCVMGTLRKARLGNILENSNLISKKNLDMCLQLSKLKNQTLGKTLIDEGVITFEKLGAVVTKQAEMIISDLISWDTGIFEYHDGRINLKNMIITPINVMGLILEVSRQRDEMKLQHVADAAIKDEQAPVQNDLTVSESDDDRFEASDAELVLKSDFQNFNGEISDSEEIIDISKEEWKTFWDKA